MCLDFGLLQVLEVSRTRVWRVLARYGAARGSVRVLGHCGHLYANTCGLWIATRFRFISLQFVGIARILQREVGGGCVVLASAHSKI